MAVAEVNAREVAPQRRARRRAASRSTAPATTSRRATTTPTRPATACVHDAPARRSPASTTTTRGGRAADRLGLLRPGPRRPDRQDQERELVLRRVQLLRLVRRLQPAGHQPGRLRQGRRHADEGDDRRRAPDQRRLVQRRPELGLDRTSTGRSTTACTSTSSTSAPTPTASCTTRSASARSTAPARRRAASRSARPPAGTDEGYTTCTFPLKNTGAAAATDPACTRRTPTAYLEQRHLPPVGHGVRHRLDGAPQERARHREVRRDASGAGLHREGRRRGRSGSVTLNARRPRATRRRPMSANCTLGDGTVGGSVPATLALTMGAPASFGAFTPGLRQGLLRHDDGERDLDRR